MNAGKTYRVLIYGPTSEMDYVDAVGNRGVTMTLCASSPSVNMSSPFPSSPPSRPNVVFNLTAPLSLAANPTHFYHLVLETTETTTQVPVLGAMSVCTANSGSIRASLLLIFSLWASQRDLYYDN
jgi:hypothetical protein